MSWQRFLRSRPTTTAWLLEPSFAAVVRCDGNGAMRCAFTTLPEGLVEAGAVGLQTVDRKRLAEALGPLQETVGGARRAAVVVPTGWVRTHLLEFDHLPRRTSELAEVVRWRLKKLLPVLPAELRLVVLPQHVSEHRQVLCMSGLERAFAELEGAFSDLGVEPGLVTPRLFALAHGSGGRTGHRLVVQHESGFLSLLLTSDGTPRLLRTKPLPPGREELSMATRELHLAYSFIRETLAVSPPLAVLVAAEDDEHEQSLGEWWGSQPGVSIQRLPLPVCSDPAAALDRFRLRPLHAVLRDEAVP